VSKREFQRIYEQYGSEQNGWISQYWEDLLEPVLDMTWHVALPASADESRMFLVTDDKTNESAWFSFRKKQRTRSFVVCEPGSDGNENLVRPVDIDSDSPDADKSVLRRTFVLPHCAVDSTEIVELRNLCDTQLDVMYPTV
jgi:hypothetical protein